MVFGRRSSYRLGRRLKSSAKARLDYITYLQTGADNGNGGDIPPGQMKATISAGGLLTADLLVSIGLSAVISGDGELRAHIGVLRPMAATVDAGGNVDGNVAIEQKLAGTIDGGGEMFAHLFPPHRVEGTIDGGGEVTAKLLVTMRLAATISAGGLLNADMIYQIGLGGTIDAGGELTADIAPKPPAEQLSGSIDGGGAVKADLINDYIFVNSEAAAVVAAFTVQPNNGRKKKIDDAVGAMKANGSWAKLHVFYMLYAHDKQATTINWKNPGTFNLTETGGGPEFVADSHCAGQGASGGYLCAKNVNTFPAANSSMWVYSDDNQENALNDMGGAIAMLINVNRAATDGFRVVAQETNFRMRANNGLTGLRGWSKTAAGAGFMQEQGTSYTFTGGSAATGQNSPIGICGWISGSYNATTRRQQAAAAGDSMTQAQMAAFHNIVQAFVSTPTQQNLSATIDGGGLVEGNATNLDASAQAIIDAMVPTPTLERQTAINTLVKALKVNPAYWNGLGGLYLFKAHSEQAAKINWKSPGTFNCVNIGTMEFVADDYIKANANSCLNTQYNPGTGPVTPFTLTTASLMVIADDTTKSDVLDAGSVGSSSVFVNANAVAATNNLRGCLSNTTTMTATITAVNGYEMYGVSRTTSGASMLLKQGVTTIATVAQDATALPSSRIAFCGTLNNSVATASPRRQRAGAWGQGLTNTGWTTITNAIKAYLDSIKTPVYMSATMTAGGLLEGNIAPQNITDATALIVAGGGGGGSGGDGTGANYSHAGGGGGGGVISVAPFTLAPGTYPVVVGSGGARGTGATAGANGGNSSFNGQTAVGGGRGAQYNAAANSGGSGGGGKGATTTWPSNTGGGAGTGGQGNTGGAGATGVYGASGGGGGATGAGGEAGFGNQAARGAAGPGLTSSISGTSRVYGQGGLGATADTGAGTSGLPNSGFGGGGGSASAWNQGGVGGSGVVVIRYPGAARGTGGTITTVGSDTVHTFTASGNLVIT